MNLIDNITDQAAQVTQVVLEDGSVLTLTLTYRPAVERWTFDVDHPLLSVQGIALCVFPNLLRPWREIISFGLACGSTDGQDPVNLQDFTSGRITLYSLDAADVADIETTFFGVPA